jgi:hypothetical protein
VSSPTRAVQAATALTRRAPGVKSPAAANIVHELYHAPIAARRHVLSGLPQKDMLAVLNEARRELGTPFGLWHDTPSGFTEDVIGDTIWSKQREVLDAIVPYKRVAVPAGFGVGKTWLAGRLVAWAGCVNPAGTMVIVTTATRFRQVRYQLWPHIRKVVAKAALPGYCDTTQWKIPDSFGNEVVVAYGFSAPDNDEAAMQGIHGTPKLLLVVDEAGGIAKLIGKGTNNLLTGDAKMLAIGNPAMDDPGSWFEGLVGEGEDLDSEDYASTTSIRISTLDSPAITGELTPVCRDCAHNPEGHRVSLHLPDNDWLKRTVQEYGGDDHPYVIAKVLAMFPKDSGNRVIPASWVEGGVNAPEPEGPDYVRLKDLGLPEETDAWMVKRGAWVRLGVDVASDGGDEFAIYRAVGDVVQQMHSSVGSANSDPNVVAERILEEIDRAQRLANALGTKAPVRVKVDKNGLGWGTVGSLERWAKTRRHRAEIVGVMVSESPEHDDEAAPMRPWNKRAEMWLTGRFLLQPDPSTGFGRLRLRIPHNAKVQLSTPEQLSKSGTGHILVESKEAMKKRGVSSPDRAEAALLAVYEGASVKKKHRGLIGED